MARAGLRRLARRAGGADRRRRRERGRRRLPNQRLRRLPRVRAGRAERGRSGRASTSSPPRPRRRASRSRSTCASRSSSPDAYLHPGLCQELMPKTYAGLPDDQLDALVQYLAGERAMTTTVEHHEHAAHAAAPPPTGGAACSRPGWLRAPWTTALFAARRRRPRRRASARSPAGTRSSTWPVDHHGRVPDHGAARLPRRHRRVRLLALLHRRPADPARGPLRPRRAGAGRTTSGSTPTTR